MTYGNIRRTVKARELDRATWSDEELRVAHFDLESALSQSVFVDFKTVFEGQPFFHFTAELQLGQVLVPGDYPIINCAVGEWQRLGTVEEPLNYYTGATVLISITSVTQYLYHFQLAFRGKVFRNVESMRP